MRADDIHIHSKMRTSKEVRKYKEDLDSRDASQVSAERRLPKSMAWTTPNAERRLCGRVLSFVWRWGMSTFRQSSLARRTVLGSSLVETLEDLIQVTLQLFLLTFV